MSLVWLPNMMTHMLNSIKIWYNGEMVDEIEPVVVETEHAIETVPEPPSITFPPSSVIEANCLMLAHEMAYLMGKTKFHEELGGKEMYAMAVDFAMDTIFDDFGRSVKSQMVGRLWAMKWKNEIIKAIFKDDETSLARLGLDAAVGHTTSDQSSE